MASRPCANSPDGDDFYTLPMLHDPSTHTWVGDSFDIAVYLDRQYASSGITLSPPSSIGVYRVFNAHVDALFTRHLLLFLGGLPFNPETAETTKAEFCRRFHLSSYEDLVMAGEARVKAMEAFEEDLGQFGDVWRAKEGQGEKMDYADIVVGGWLGMMKECLGEGEWEMLCNWQGGRWGRLHESLEMWAEIR
jgi:hypothetical protein